MDEMTRKKNLNEEIISKNSILLKATQYLEMRAFMDGNKIASIGFRFTQMLIQRSEAIKDKQEEKVDLELMQETLNALKEELNN